MNVSLSDLTPLAGLTNLGRLYLYGNTSLTDLSPLSGLTNLTELDLTGSAAQDVSPLAGLEGLFIYQ